MSLDTLEVEVHLIIRNKETQAHAPAFGRGIARLCEGVERTGSLNKACKEMGMAYSKAWKIMHNTEHWVLLCWKGRAHVALCSLKRRRCFFKHFVKLKKF